MRKYKSHKVVEAAKIVDTNQHGRTIDIESDGVVETVTPSDLWWLNFHSANRQYVDGYYVRYEDGYDSWSPANVFEEGYTPVDS